MAYQKLWLFSPLFGKYLILHADSSPRRGCLRRGGVSKELLGALEWLASCLGMLSQHLDSVAFREVWRSAAIALNRLLYNDVATEARFSAEVTTHVQHLNKAAFGMFDQAAAGTALSTETILSCLCVPWLAASTC